MAYFKHPNSPPSFESIMYPIRLVCDRSSFINGFRFELGMPLSEKFQMLHTWNLMNKSPPKNNPMKQPQKSSYIYQLTYGYPNMMQSDVALIAKGEGEGKLEGYIVTQINKDITAKFTTAFMNSNPQQGMLGIDIDYECNQSFIQPRNRMLDLRWLVTI